MVTMVDNTIVKLKFTEKVKSSCQIYTYTCVCVCVCEVMNMLIN